MTEICILFERVCVKFVAFFMFTMATEQGEAQTYVLPVMKYSGYEKVMTLKGMMKSYSLPIHY